MASGHNERDDDDDELQEEEEEAVAEVDPNALEDGSRTIIVGDWSRVKSISAALELASPTDAIFCSAGLYEEHVQLTKTSIDLSGPTDLSAHILQGLTSVASFCSVSHFRISGGINVRCGNLVVSSCDVHQAQHGIQIFRTANPTVQRCTIHAVEKAHVAVFPGGKGLIEQCELTGDGHRGSVGLYVDDAESTVFRLNKVSNMMTGVYTLHGCNGVVVCNNQFSKLTGHGVYADQQSKPQVKDNEIKDAAHYGLLVANGSGGSFAGNVVHASVRIHKSCCPSFVGNVVVMPGEIVNDDSLYALRGIVVKRLQDLPKQRKGNNAGTE
eukprot:GGOE01055071.1.p1 GENE.GGOE01055071.1~~GGOE01055071.1.p1  ORF type:complete len:326 (-),score=92.19 GGOE01055071.1:164-1141(-)